MTAMDTLLVQGSPQVHIVPSIYPEGPHMPGTSTILAMGNGADPYVIGRSCTMASIVRCAYGGSPYRTIFPAEGLPNGRYDFISNVAQNRLQALQKALADQFAITAVREQREVDVMVVILAAPNSPGLKPPNSQRASLHAANDARCVNNSGVMTWFDATLKEGGLLDGLEMRFNKPVVDETGLVGHYDFSYPQQPAYNFDLDDTRKRTLQPLGLDLVPAKRKIEILVVSDAGA
jgi:uncharacterized protein (TIGR03435 family)